MIPTTLSTLVNSIAQTMSSQVLIMKKGLPYKVGFLAS